MSDETKTITLTVNGESVTKLPVVPHLESLGYPPCKHFSTD